MTYIEILLCSCVNVTFEPSLFHIPARLPTLTSHATAPLTPYKTYMCFWLNPVLYHPSFFLLKCAALGKHVLSEWDIYTGRLFIRFGLRTASKSDLCSQRSCDSPCLAKSRKVPQRGRPTRGSAFLKPFFLKP